MTQGKVGSKAIVNTFATNVIISAMNLFTGVIAARLLQPAGRGELATIILWPSIIVSLGIMGTNWALSREVSCRPNDEANLARTAMVVSLTLAVLSMVLGYIVVPYLLPTDKIYLLNITRIYLLWIPLKFVCLNLLALDYGGLHWRRFNFYRISEPIWYFICLLAFWVYKIRYVSWFVIALLVSNLVTASIQFFYHRQGISQGHATVTSSLCILRKGLPFFGAALSGVAATQIDKALLVTLLPTEAVGWYVAAFAFASAHGALGLALGLTSFAALANEREPLYQGRYLATIFRQSTLLYLGAGSLVALMAPMAIVPLFGEKFAPAVTPAAIMALTTSFNALGNILNEGLRGLGNTLPGIIAQLLGTGVVVLGAWIMVPSHGIIGLAWATVVGGGFQLLMLVGVVIWLFGLKPAQLWGVRVEEVKALYGRIFSLLPN